MKRIKIWGVAISTLFVAATFCFTSTANADLVTFEFFSGNDLGAALENADDDFTGTEAGITFVASATGPDDAVPDAASGTSGLGVNSTVTNDAGTQIDPGETLSIQINFDPAAFSKVELTNVDLGNIGDPGDGGDVTFPDGSMVTFLDDATAPAGFEFNSGDNIAPTTPIALVSGATLVFNTPAGQTGGEFRVQRLTLHLDPIVVPEPSSLGLLGLLGLGIVARRRR